MNELKRGNRRILRNKVARMLSSIFSPHLQSSGEKKWGKNIGRLTMFVVNCWCCSTRVKRSIMPEKMRFSSFLHDLRGEEAGKVPKKAAAEATHGWAAAFQLLESPLEVWLIGMFTVTIYPQVLLLGVFLCWNLSFWGKAIKKERARE